MPVATRLPPKVVLKPGSQSTGAARASRIGITAFRKRDRPQMSDTNRLLMHQAQSQNVTAFMAGKLDRVQRSCAGDVK